MEAEDAQDYAFCGISPTSATPRSVRFAYRKEGSTLSDFTSSQVKRRSTECELWTYRPPDWVPLGIRDSPSLSANIVPDEFLEPGQVFDVADIWRGGGVDGVTFLRLADGRGWVFDRKPECGMLCFRFFDEDAEVSLCTYRLTLPCDCLLQLLKKFYIKDADAYHVGVVVYGREWAFYGGFHEQEGPDATGVRYLPPGAWAPDLCQVAHLGRTRLSELEANAVIQALEDKWLSADYRLLTRNCCHFAEEFCRRLKVGPIPNEVQRLDLFASREVVEVVRDGKEMRGAARTDTFYTTDFCCGLAAYGRRSKGKGVVGTSCYSFLKKPYYWVRGVYSLVHRVRHSESQMPIVPQRSRLLTESR